MSAAAVKQAIAAIRAPAIEIEEATGRARANGLKFGQNPFWIMNDSAPLSVAASQALPATWFNPQDGDGAGDLRVMSLVAVARTPFLCELRELVENSGLLLQNAPVHHDHMFGVARQPFMLACPLYIPAGYALQGTITNLSTTVACSFKGALHGERWNVDAPPELRQAVKDAYAASGKKPFWLTLDRTSASLSASQGPVEYFLSAPSGYVFVPERLMFESTGIFNFDIWDHQTGRQLTYGGPIDSRLIAPNGTFGGCDVKLLGPLMTEPQQKLRVQFTDTSGAANVIYMTLHGTLVPA